MAGARAVLKNVFTIYICYRFLMVWWFNEPITLALGILVILLLLSSIIFLLEIFGIL